MGKIREPPPVKLIVSMFTGDETLLAVARGALVNRFGPIDYQSELLPFHHTDYYAREFGPGLVRQIVALAELIPLQQLAEIKRATNELELTWAVDGKRRVNLDPGYVSLGKLVLATTKDQAHRLCIGPGLFAEVTLRYSGGRFVANDWTYPDYRSEAYHQFLGRARALLMAQLRSAAGGG